MESGPKIGISADLTHLAEEVYADSAKKILQQTSHLGEDLLKTVRLVLYPFQLGAYYQDRLARHLQKALSRVDDSDVGAPIPSLTLQIADRIKFYDQEDLVSEMYSQLLSLSLDTKNYGKAHPAFVNIVSQLSGDEAKLIEHLAPISVKMYVGRDPLPWAQSMQGIRDFVSSNGVFIPEQQYSDLINPDFLAESTYLQTYIQHLESLGLVCYRNEVSHSSVASHFPSLTKGEAWFVGLTKFGKLFHNACVEKAIKAFPEDRI